MSLEPARESLMPGYKLVEEFSRELADDYEEETSYVTLDFGNIDTTPIDNASSYTLIGLDTPTPFLQVGPLIFKGEYDDLLGSELLLHEPATGERRKPKVVPLDVSSGRRIRFREVTMTRKTAPEDSDEANEDGENGEDEKVPEPPKTSERGRGRPRGRPRIHPVKVSSGRGRGRPRSSNTTNKEGDAE